MKKSHAERNLMEAYVQMKDKMNQIRMQTGCPYYDEEKHCWHVRFKDRSDEEGDLLYVVSEFIKGSLIYRYSVRQTQKHGINGHAHSFEGVLRAVLDDPDSFTIDGFETDYSSQEIEMLKAFKNYPQLTETLSSCQSG